MNLARGIWIWLMTLTLAWGAGRQLGGVYTPAQTPALRPADAQKKFKVPEGFEVRLFAAEPDVVNPVAMTWDDRGRLWVVELYEYPLGAPAGRKGRDRIKILEDTDRDGRADRVSVFADGLNLASGILLGYGGAFVGQAPHLLFLKDTNGDDVADEREILLSGFGRQDTHELINSFAWGPDGWMYMTQGVFTQSKARDPEDPDDDGVYLDGGVARFHPRTRRFEVFADGTSNPWGVDFDRHGHAFVSACVIDHLFHLSPGGLYARQAASPPNPYAYELLPSIVDHKHFRAAYAGVQIYQGHQFPEAYRGLVFMGNIHGNQINCDVLSPAGSTFKASARPDFLDAQDGWFRPVSEQVGPDGALWIMDWYDKYPCYQNANADPEGVDREHGRIWRVVYTGKEPGRSVPPHPRGMHLSKLPGPELVRLLEHPNIWQRRMAQRLLSERRDASLRPRLERMFRNSATLEGRLFAYWTLHSAGLLQPALLEAGVRDREPAVRLWTARFLGERGDPSPVSRDWLLRLAADSDPHVRVASAVAARQWTSGSLTVNTAPRQAVTFEELQPIFRALARHPGGTDRLLAFTLWTAMEPLAAKQPAAALAFFRELRAGEENAAPVLLSKTMRRFCDLQQPDLLRESLGLLQELLPREPGLVAGGLQGLVEGQSAKPIPPAQLPAGFFEAASRSSNPDVVRLARRLGTLWGDSGSLMSLYALLQNTEAPLDQRIQALETLRKHRSERTRSEVLAVVKQGSADRLLQEALRALGELGGERIASELLSSYPGFTPPVRRVALEVLASRAEWSRSLLEAIEQRTLRTEELPVGVIRSLTQHPQAAIRERAIRTIGRYREPGQDQLKLLAEKRKVALQGPVNVEKGREIARKTCLVCHKFHGEGAEVGPDLTGVGRSTLDALLVNIIAPNQIVGQGYEQVEVETRDGRTVTGRLIENSDNRVRLLGSGGKEEAIARSEIARMEVSELSLMPEGLEQMPDEDFRNLVWFILNPPEDKRPLTPQLRRELTGE